MYNILVAIYLLFAFLILRSKGEKRLVYFILGVFMLPGNINVIANSMLMGYTLYTTLFLISMIYHKEFKINNCPLNRQLLIVFISCLLIGLFDERLGPIMGMWRGVQYFLTTSFLFVFGWITAQGKTIDVIENNILERKEDDYVFSSILPFTLIITIFGVITAITKTNPILDAVGLENRFLFEFDESYRSFRVTGASISSSVYGISCAILFMCCCFLTNKRNKIIYLALGLLFINNLLSATRAAMIPFFVGLLIFLVLQKGVTKLSKYLLVGILSITLLFPILPNGVTDYFTQLTESIVDVLSPGSGGEKFVGSSVDARDMQISKAMIYLEEKPFFGHGIGYANEVILKGEKNEELLGMESYLCFIGIEYGLVYAVAITVFLISCLMYYINNRKYSPTFAYLGISFIVMYILYLIYAWVGTSWYFMMPVLGYTAKKIYLAKDVYIKSKKL